MDKQRNGLTCSLKINVLIWTRSVFLPVRSCMQSTFLSKRELVVLQVTKNKQTKRDKSNKMHLSFTILFLCDKVSTLIFITNSDTAKGGEDIDPALINMYCPGRAEPSGTLGNLTYNRLAVLNGQHALLHSQLVSAGSSDHQEVGVHNLRFGSFNTSEPGQDYQDSRPSKFLVAAIGSVRRVTQEFLVKPRPCPAGLHWDYDSKTVDLSSWFCFLSEELKCPNDRKKQVCASGRMERERRNGMENETLAETKKNCQSFANLIPILLFFPFPFRLRPFV